jgi:hypothetical protein
MTTSLIPISVRLFFEDWMRYLLAMIQPRLWHLFQTRRRDLTILTTRARGDKLK